MSSHLVDTSEDENCVVAVTRFISDLLDEGQSRTALADTAGSNFSRECDELIEADRFDEVLGKLVEQFSLLFSKASSGDVEAALGVCVYLLNDAEGAQQSANIQKLAQALVSQEGGHPEARLTTLLELFNLSKDAKVQYQLLLQAIAFAKASGQSTLLAPGIRSHIDGWVKEWDLSTAEQQKLYLAVADLFRANKKRKALIKEAYKLTVRALATMQDVPSSELADVKAIAQSAVTEFIGSPDVFQFDLFASPAVKQLQGDPEHAPLYQLLSIVLAGDVKGLDDFLKSNPRGVESIGTTEPAVRTKTQLMALMGLATTESHVSYAKIQAQLGLSDIEEVEDWLVKAMGKKLMGGQMDQVKQQVTITKASYRTFGPDNWQILLKQLAAWKENVASARDLVTAGEPASGLQSLQGGQNGQKNPAPRSLPNGVQV
jgi:translation initiation factor 3 subunit M